MSKLKHVVDGRIIFTVFDVTDRFWSYLELFSQLLLCVSFSLTMFTNILPEVFLIFFTHCFSHTLHFNTFCVIIILNNSFL